MRTRTRLIGLIAAGALLVGCGSTTAGTGVLGTVAGAPPAASDQVSAPDDSSTDSGESGDSGNSGDSGDSGDSGQDDGAVPAVPTAEEQPGDDQALPDDPNQDESGGDAAVPSLPGDVDGCMSVSIAYLSIILGPLATSTEELDQLLVDIDTALASAPADIKPALQTLADISRSAQGKSIEELGTIMSSPEYTAASDEVSKWLETACGG